MSKVSFKDDGWLHYLYWQMQDRKTVRGDETIVISCKGHYDDK